MLSYSLPSDGDVEISVYDAAGSLVARPISGEWRVAGSGVVRLSIPGLASGIYWATVRTDDASATTKIIAID